MSLLAPLRFVVLPLHLNRFTVHSYLAANLQSADLPCMVACELQPVNVSMLATDLNIQLGKFAPRLEVMAGIRRLVSTCITSEDASLGFPCTHSTQVHPTRSDLN
jgi:hypothetical protein